MDLYHLLEKDGWFNKYSIDALKKMTPLESIKCLIETLEDPDTRRHNLSIKNNPFDIITVFRIRKNKNLKHINLLGF